MAMPQVGIWQCADADHPVKEPLAIYPDAIGEAAALIDRGQTDQAKLALRAALDTLIVIDHMNPLPVLTAETFLEVAEAPAENDSRTAGESETLGLFIKGGSQDAMDLFVAFRGRKPEVEPLLRHSGIAA